MNLMLMEVRYPSFVMEMSHETKELFERFREFMSPVAIDQV